MNEFKPEQEETLRQVEESIRESIETVFQTGVNPEAQVRLGEIARFNREFFDESFREGLVLVKIPHKNSDSGEEYFLFSHQTSAQISDLMVMGDGIAEFNPEEHLDAMQEVVDQIYGAFSTSSADVIAADLDYGLTEGAHGESSLLDIADDSWMTAEFTLELEQAHILYHLLSPAALDNFTGQKPKPSTADVPAESVAPQAEGAPQGAPQTAQFQSFGPEQPGEQKLEDIEMLMDLRLPITIELGRTSMFIKDILKLSPGSIVELDKLSGDPVDIYVNEKKFAEGEVVVIDENFGVRITDLIRPEDRLRKLS